MPTSLICDCFKTQNIKKPVYVVENIERPSVAFENFYWKNVRHSKDIYIEKRVHFRISLINCGGKIRSYDWRYSALEVSGGGQ